MSTFPFNITNPGIFIDGLLTTVEREYVTDLVLAGATASENDVLTWKSGAPSWEPSSGGGYTNLTQFVDQTAWRVFYSNTDGDVVELALGADGTFLKSNGATSAPSFAVPAGSGDVSKVGTPVNNQVGVWTGDGTLEGDVDLTFDTTTNFLSIAPVALDGRLVTHAVRGDATDGLLIESANGTDVARLGVTNTANSTFFGAVNIDGATRLATSLTGILRADSGAVSVDADVVEGPASSTDNALARFDSTTGKLLQDGTISASDVSVGAVTLATIGNNDLILKTGNATTGSITIEDGANGMIDISPNGTGDIRLNGEVNFNNYVVSSIIPLTNGAYDLGGSSRGWTNIYMADGGDIDFGNGTAFMGNVTASSAIYVGPGNAAGVLQSYGNFDLTLRTGNATTGNINIVDGAGGDIQINPNGTGSLVVDGDIKPSANDGGALGTTAAQFSDLFLAEGGVINWDNGDATLTQTNNVLALAGADLQVATAGVGTNADSVPTLSSTSTLTNKTLAAPIIDYVVEPPTDDTYEGITTNDINAGATIAQWEAVYLDSTPDWNLTDASAAATAGGVMIALATESGTAANPLRVLLSGIARNDGWTWTAGGPIYLSETAGALTQTAPTTASSVTRIVGYALSDDAIYWNPSNDWVVHV